MRAFPKVFLLFPLSALQHPTETAAAAAFATPQQSDQGRDWDWTLFRSRKYNTPVSQQQQQQPSLDRPAAIAIASRSPCSSTEKSGLARPVCEAIA
jgi:hypothetical protein